MVGVSNPVPLLNPNTPRFPLTKNGKNNNIPSIFVPQVFNLFLLQFVGEHSDLYSNIKKMGYAKKIRFGKRIVIPQVS